MIFTKKTNIIWKCCWCSYICAMFIFILFTCNHFLMLFCSFEIKLIKVWKLFVFCYSYLTDLLSGIRCFSIKKYLILMSHFWVVLWSFLSLLVLLFIERHKTKALKKFDPWTWCTKKPFGYRVIYHGCSLMSCPGLQRQCF